MCDGESDNDFDELSLADSEYNRLNEKLEKDGLRDGIIEGKENGMQKGFDIGYNGSFKCYHSVYFLKGILSAIESANKHSSEMSNIISLRNHFEAIERLINNKLDENSDLDERNDEIQKKFKLIKCEIIALCATNHLESLTECINECEL